MSIYDFNVKTIDRVEISTSEYKGNVADRYAPSTKPASIKEAIEKLLEK